MSDAIAGLIVAASQLEEDAPTAAQLAEIIERGEFRRAEDGAIGFWFARFLTARENLWAIIEEIRAVLDRPVPIVGMQKELRLFLVGYAAVCLLVRIDRLLLRVADHSLVKRKLYEAFPEYRIPRKQFTAIYSGFVDQGNVLAVRDAMQFARKHRHELSQLQSDPDVGYIARQLPQLEASLNPSALSHLKRAVRYVSHKWRRRGVAGAEKTFATVLEGFGRVASEFCERLRPLSETLGVDAFVVLRPNLAATTIAKAIERAMLHEGKNYNFDFFNSDRIVCTEVIYRAYDGLEDLEIPLFERAGRKTLSAEDLLDYALDKQTFTPVAIFGVDTHEDSMTYGEGVCEKLVGSYRYDN